MRFLLWLWLVLAALPAAAEIRLTASELRPAAPGEDAPLYLVLDNTGQREDRIVGATTPFAEAVTLVGEDNPGEGVLLPEAQTTYLVAGTPHMVLSGLTVPLADGDTIVLTVEFYRAGRKLFTVPVAAQAPHLTPGISR